MAIREQQNQGYLPDGTTRLSRNGEPIRHFMGTSTFAEFTVMPEIALAKIDPEAPLDRACLFACGLSTGLGAAMNTAKVAGGSTCVVFGAGMVGLGAVAGCRLQGAERIVCVDLSQDTARARTRSRARPTRSCGGPEAVQQIVDMTDGFGADYTFEATGNVDGHAAGGRIGTHGLGPRDDVRRRREGRDAERHPALPDHRAPGGRLLVRRRERTRPGSAVRRHAISPATSTWMPFVSHKLTLDDVNRGFELMEAQDGIRSVIDLT